MFSLERITLLVTDVDGVLTDGRIRLLPDGEEVKVFHARDGSAIRRAMENGIEVAFLSGRGGGAVASRARELGVTQVVLSSSDKESDFRAILRRTGRAAGCAAYVGDDVVDLPVFSVAGFSACPSDASPDVKEAVDQVLTTPGGDGVIKEMVDLLLSSRNR